MEKDINVLLGTTNDEIFEEQVKHWPGVEVFREHGWNCVCEEEGCFRKCVQFYANEFPSKELFGEYIEAIVGVDSRKSLQDFTLFFVEHTKKKKALH